MGPKQETSKEPSAAKAETADENKSFSFELTPRTKKIALGIIVVLLIIFGGAYYYKTLISEEETDPVVALVNNEKVFLSQLDSAYASVNMQKDQSLTKEEVMDMLIDQMVLLQSLYAADLSIMDSEVEEFIETVLEKRELPKEVFYEEAQKNGLSKQAVLKMFKDKILIQKFYEQKIHPKIEITDEMKQNFYEMNREMFFLPDAVNVSHILVETEEEAEDIKAELENGVAISELAGLSKDPSAAENKGNLGYIFKGQTVPEFENAAFSLQEGGISEPVQTSYGYHIIVVSDIEPSKYLSYEETEKILHQLLFNKKKQEFMRIYLDGIKAKSNIQKFEIKKES